MLLGASEKEGFMRTKVKDFGIKNDRGRTDQLLRSDLYRAISVAHPHLSESVGQGCLHL